MLFVQSLDEIIYEDVPENQRFMLQPDVSNLLYKFREIPFHYQLVDHVPAGIKGLENFDPGRYYAQFSKSVGGLRDFRTGKKIASDYFTVDVWREIDDEFKDVFIAHELFEMSNNYRDKLPEKQAHAKSVVETDEYLKKYFTEQQRERYNVMLSQLDKKRLEPSKMKVTVHKIGKLNIIERNL